MTAKSRAEGQALLAALSADAGAIARAVLEALSQPAQAPVGAFGQLLGVRFSQFGDGRCAGSLVVGDHLLNPHGIAHGAIAFALADFVCGGAALSALGEPRLVTQDMQIRYHGPVRPGPLDAEAETVHLGSRTITTQCRVSQNGTLVASVTGTFAILSPVEVDNLRAP